MTDGMADSRSLMVTSGIMTSFWDTTLVMPSFVTIFMAEGEEKGQLKRQLEKEKDKPEKQTIFDLSPRDRQQTNSRSS